MRPTPTQPSRRLSAPLMATPPAAIVCSNLADRAAHRQADARSRWAVTRSSLSPARQKSTLLQTFGAAGLMGFTAMERWASIGRSESTTTACARSAWRGSRGCSRTRSSARCCASTWQHPLYHRHAHRHLGTDKLGRFCLLPQDEEPIMWDFGSAARHTSSTDPG